MAPPHIVPSTSKGRLLITCEHAGQDLPAHINAATHVKFKDTHWAYDPGAKELTDALCLATGAPAVMSLISRLYCDVNRPVGSDTLARHECDGILVPMNEKLDTNERERRVRDIWLPYHMATAEMANTINATRICSVHSFNPIYEGKRRDHVEVGVLSSFGDELALHVKAQLEADGFERVLLNVPWSGKKGIMYSADCVGFASSTVPRQTVMIEIRNDLLTGAKSKAYIRKMVNSLVKALL